MRWFHGLLAAGGLILAGGSVTAQDLGGFGGYPAGITTGSPYGFYPGGYRQTYSNYSTTAGTVTVPHATYYSSGFYGGTPGTTTYGPGVDLSSPNAAAYGYSAPYQGYAPNYGYSPYGYRGGVPARGMLGVRRGYR